MRQTLNKLIQLGHFEEFSALNIAMTQQPVVAELITCHVLQIVFSSTASANRDYHGYLGTALETTLDKMCCMHVTHNIFNGRLLVRIVIFLKGFSTRSPPLAHGHLKKRKTNFDKKYLMQ